MLCLSVTGWFVMLRRSAETVRRWIILTGAVLTIVTLSFYLTRTQNYNYGGNSVGLRWLLWLTPFWWLAMVPIVEQCKSRTARATVATLLLISITSVSWSLHRPWRPSWLYERMESYGWIHYRSSPEPFETPRSSVFGSMPAESGTTMTWRSSAGTSLTMMVSNQQPSDGFLRLSVTLGDSAAASTMIDLDLRRWNEHGEVLTRGSASAAARLFEQLASGFPDAIDSVPGTARRRQFLPAGTTWIPSMTIPASAWKAERGAARIVVEDKVFGKCWHRCDVMYCDQLPFGVLQWKTQTTLDSTGEVIAVTTWVAEQKSLDHVKTP